ncbi:MULTISPECIES: helix-turn-helix domain-containing protein [Cohnella]|uniref:helix-turn-helix domain-containing protein n=1 Tax=Cohnella TaxID=329857 RepID=UPI0009BC354E|nr:MULTISPECIES: XRE family transcriptional regulator [Cohnella]MBN2981236.1 helix-turn-helix transcriptional regulator [Cohnella algarum]
MDKIGEMEFPKGVIGRRIRKIRKEQGLTVDELSKKAGLSQSMVSQIETGQTNPSLDTLWKISHGLNVPVFSFFQDIASSDVHLTKRQDQKTVNMLHPNVLYRALSPSLDNGFEMFEMRIRPGEAKPSPQLARQGREIGYLLEGELHVLIEDRTFRLEAGDSIVFESSQKHEFYNPGDGDAVGIWVMLPRGRASVG